MATAATQAGLHDELGAALDDAGLSFVRHQGAEHYLDDTLFAQPFDGHVVPYADTKWLLVELPYHGRPPGLFDLLFRIKKAGYRILLAHLERFPYVTDDDEDVQRLLDSGVLIQVNLGSLSGGYSRAHKKAAERLVSEGYASVASSDCHRAQDVKKYVKKGLRALEKLVGAEEAVRLTQINPRAILDDEEPQKIWP